VVQREQFVIYRADLLREMVDEYQEALAVVGEGLRREGIWPTSATGLP
jgi:hypothetical protein